jgi:deazaflavin-dependent oxidoreductase (nitroreductase family)
MAEMNDWNRQIIEEFRANQGKVGGMFAGATLLILHSKGAKSGKEHVNPVMYRQDGDRYVVFASKGGAPTNPDWYHNLVANPDAKVEVGTDTVDVGAVVTKDEERDELWSKQVADYPQFGEYEKKTTRKIPVVALERRGS